MGLFSIITLCVNDKQKQGIKVQSSAWYRKVYPIFSDAIASVRTWIWQNQKFLTSSKTGEVNNLNESLINHLYAMMTRAA